MRSLEEILHDFEICYFNEDGSCNGCSYCGKGCCSDNENSLDNEVYQYLKGNNYKDGMNVDYENGMDVAWELAKTVKNMDKKDIKECFGITNGFYGVMNKYNAQEAKRLYDEWKYNKTVNVGDVLHFYTSGCYAIVTNIKHARNNAAFLLFRDGSCEEQELTDYIKVGHLDITPLFQTIDNFKN